MAQTPATDAKPLLILIDGHSLAFRAYYAFSTSRRGALRNSAGVPTSVCFGFLNSLFQIVESYQPDRLAIAFDLGIPTFRHEADPGYKAGRAETPEDFIPDIENLQTLLEALKITIATSPGYEADDVLGTLATRANSGGYRVKILSGDRDLFQLVDEAGEISILYPSPGAMKAADAKGYTDFDALGVADKLGVRPDQVVDYKALCGDKSDNIPGVRGIGEKTAVKLLAEYDTLENVYNNVEAIKGAIGKKLIEGKEDAKHSRFLAQIELEAPITVTVDDCVMEGFNRDRVRQILEELELRTFLARLDQLQVSLGGTVEAPPKETTNVSANGQFTLFAEEKAPELPVPQLETYDIQPRIIDTPEKLTELVELLQTFQDPQNPVAWDTETTGLNPRDIELVGLGCCWGTEPDAIAYIPTFHTEGDFLQKAEVLKALQPILESADYPKTLQNAKFDRVVLQHQGIKLAGVTFDTMLASYLLRPERSHKLEELATQYLGNVRSLSYKDLGIPKGKTIADLEIEKVAVYCGLDCYVTYALAQVLQVEVEQYTEIKGLLYDVEQPLEPILATMEDDGILIDVEYLKTFSQQLGEDLDRIETGAYEDAGETFNLASPKQLGVILFDKLGLDTKKSRKTKSGFSTDQATLEKLRDDHPLVSKILEYRTLAKLKSTYVDALPALVHPATGRVHTNFNQAVTTTGRLSSSDPNLQNIPIRTDFSRKIRQAFLPQPGWQLVSVDYSQIELRILTHFSQQPVLMEAYQTGEDVHSVTAKLIFDKETITSEERRLGKIINFGVIYGMGAQRFAREAGVSSAEGKEFIQKYRDRYAEVFDYLDLSKQTAVAQGYVTTLLGRRRYFEFGSRDLKRLQGQDPQYINLDAVKMSYIDSQSLRAAANAPIQGSSADIIKVAMVQLDEILKGFQARMLLQVHDELVFEVPPEEWTELKPLIVKTMQEAVSLSIPLVVDVNVGQNWMEAK
ncbi:MAG: DNA polymerase I [Cyanobacteria bacterium P01_H01_bin.15]